jgi:hypothetical protein
VLEHVVHVHDGLHLRVHAALLDADLLHSQTRGEGKVRHMR